MNPSGNYKLIAVFSPSWKPPACYHEIENVALMQHNTSNKTDSRSMSNRFSRTITLSVLMVSLSFMLFSACGKINICGKEDKLIGSWIWTSYTIGDSTVTLVDLDLLPPGIDTVIGPLGIPLTPYYTFYSDGFYSEQFLIDTTKFARWQLQRFERKCLIAIDSFEYRWQITNLTSNNMDVESFFYFEEEDSLVETALTFVRLGSN